MANGSPHAAGLRQNADAISRTFSQCERTCLEVGGRLGDAIPGLNDLAGLFETLSQSLESDDFRAAGLDLQAVARDIELTGNELAEESKTLADLVSLNKAITGQVVNLSSSVRTISALVFNVKIEVASLHETTENMIDFAGDLQRQATRAQRALDEFQSKHIKLYDLLRSSCDAQAGFQKKHQANLRSIAIEITESLAVVAVRRREIAAALADIAEGSQHIGMQIGQGVVALQIGDSTRQRIEHVHKALHLAADQLEVGSASNRLVDLNTPPEVEGRAIAAQICRLQSLQVDAALDDFTSEMKKIASLLRGLEDDSGKLASRGKALFGSNGRGANSFLEQLERKLKAARGIVEECRASRAIVDQAVNTVVTTMADLNQRTAGLSEIVVDMTIIGTNAILKSNRLGQRGKGLNVIAQELRDYASRVVQGIKALPPALQEVLAFVERFSNAGSAHNAIHLTALGERMTAAIGSFELSGTRMSEALTRLDKEADGVCDNLKEAVIRLSSHKEIGAALLQAVRFIDDLEFQIGDPSDVGAQSGAVIDRLLRGNYTMASERQIHDTFLGTSSHSARMDFVTTQSGEAEDADQLAEECLF
jgi:hypothetical protein